MTTIRSLIAVTGLLATTALPAAGCGGDDPARPATTTTAAQAPRVVHLDADHPTFSTVADARAGAALVVVGTVSSQTVDPGTSPGVDGAGDPLPPVPHTRYVVRVERTIKGAAEPGSTITVALAGGTVDGAKFVLDGGPVLAVGDTSMFFLRAGDDGAYYPLAGGAAVAARLPDGSFALPAEATVGQAALPVTPDGVAPGGGAPPSGGNGGGGGGGGTGAVGGTGTPADGGPPLAVTVKLASRQTLATALSRGLRLVTTCSASCHLFGQVIASGATAKSLKLTRKARRTVVASGSAKRTGTLVLRFDRRSAKALRRRTRTKLSIAIVAGDAKGTTATVRAVLDLRRTKLTLRRG